METPEETPKNTVTLTLTAIQFAELMNLFDWKFRFMNVDLTGTKKLWAAVVRQTGGIPSPAYDLGETDPKPVTRETPKASPTPKRFWQFWKR